MTLNLRRNILQLAATITIGLVAGFAAVAFHEAMILLANGLVEAPSKWPLGAFALFVLTAMGAAAAVTGWMMKRFAPDAPGSGIPQVKVAYHRGQLDFSWRLVWVKFLGGALSIGTGSSLGREGPTIHIGAALGEQDREELWRDVVDPCQRSVRGFGGGAGGGIWQPARGRDSCSRGDRRREERGELCRALVVSRRAGLECGLRDVRRGVEPAGGSRSRVELARALDGSGGCGGCRAGRARFPIPDAGRSASAASGWRFPGRGSS